MAVKTNETQLKVLLQGVESGRIQLPDFQRDWVWDDDKICKLIESIASGFPMGAAMMLDTGNENVRFTYRPFTGTNVPSDVKPDTLVLDGQQRLTTLFQVFHSKNATITTSPNDKKHIKRFYYIDIVKALEDDVISPDAILSVPENKLITENIGRDIKRDLSTTDKEYAEFVFPLNIVFDTEALMDWQYGIYEYDKANGTEYVPLFRAFQKKILSNISDYVLPVISLTKDTSKDAVCQIFENVNTGGVKLTVFELLTASFAADEFNLREDWKDIESKLVSRNQVLSVVSNTHFLTAVTLLSSYRLNLSTDGKKAVSCKKRDVLKLSLSEYQANRDWIVKGFMKAADFLVHQGVFTAMDLPYTSQLIPLAAIFAYAELSGINTSIQNHKDIISRWYWCGVFGEQYGAANEARYALDIVGVIDQLKGSDVIPDTVSRATVQPGRLLTMQTRNSAAYKGVMALILQDSPLDFMSANKMDVAQYLAEDTDIHHIFPQNYCSQRYDSAKWNSVVNKTPIYAGTNRSIGGRAPSEYIRTMANKGLTEEQIREAITSHKINYDLLVADDFERFIVDRAIRLLDRIELAMGKSIAGRDSEETIKIFGNSLTPTLLENE